MRKSCLTANLSSLDIAVEQSLNTLEIERKQIASLQIRGYLFLGLGITLGVVFLANSFIPFGIIILLGGIIPGSILLSKSSTRSSQYRTDFKHQVIGSILKQINSTLQLDPNVGIGEQEFLNSQLFTTNPDRYRAEDFIYGKDDKTNFYFSEVHAEYKTVTTTKNGTKTEWHDIFKGIVFCADFNKNFNGVTVVRPKGFGSSVGAWLKKNVFRDNTLVELENQKFNNLFSTYSTDQIEARYLLTPALMEKICELEQRCAYTISLSFIGTRMYVAFPLDTNYLEAPVFKSLLKPGILDNDIAMLNFMCGIAKDMDLNTRIWTKQ